MVENDLQTTNNNTGEIIAKHDLPTDCAPLTHQVAGHFYGKGRTKLGLLQTNDGHVLKPVQSPPRGEREHNFFKDIFESDEKDLNENQRALKKLLPIYRGSLIHNDIIYIKMDDMAYGIKYPAVIDLKIGRVTFDPEATPEKIKRQKLKYPPVEKIGFQLIGMRVFDNLEDKTFSHFDKIFGRSLAESDLIHGLALFFQFHMTPRIQAIKETIHHFETILAWFLKQTTYHFYSSSLIVVYDANQSDTSPDSPCRIHVKMADFAHVFPANETLDENYIFGIKNLIGYLKLLLNKDYKFKDVRNINNNNQ